MVEPAWAEPTVRGSDQMFDGSAELWAALPELVFSVFPACAVLVIGSLAVFFVCKM